MKIISAEEVHAALRYPDLVDALQEAYSRKYHMPPRHVYLLEEGASHDAFALLPSWNDSVIGVKAFTYFPDNPKPKYQSLYSKILLFDRKHGEPLALVDGTSVTFWRTAGISGLASRLLSRKNSETLLVLGTGNLSTYIMRAQASVRPLKRILVWGRTPANAQRVAARMATELKGIEVTVAENLQSACGQADIIVSATGAHEPLVQGAWIKEGTHTDFIGNHHATKRECDTALVTKSRVYVDSRDNAFKEAGEILVPIAEGAFSKDRIIGQLSEICAGTVPLRTSDRDITFFKSIGMALSDLIGASQVYRASASSKPA